MLSDQTNNFYLVWQNRRKTPKNTLRLEEEPMQAMFKPEDILHRDLMTDSDD